MNTAELHIYRMGRAARRRGLRAQRCPYQAPANRKLWLRGWREEGTEIREAGGPRDARDRRLMKASRAKKKMIVDTITKPAHFNPTVMYVIFSKKDRRPRLGWGCFHWMRDARQKLKAIGEMRTNFDRKAFGICKADVRAMPGRTW